MRIAFISYEYPPETALGGIATYLRQIARVLAARGHQVEVFAASKLQGRSEDDQGVLVHRVPEFDRETFASAAVGVFRQRHQEVEFDVIEGPEYWAEAREVVSAFPDMPFVLRLHTPSYLMWRQGQAPTAYLAAKHWLGSLRRGIKPRWHPLAGFEWKHARQADIIATPSVALGELLTKAWSLDSKRVRHLPYAFEPSPRLLEISPDTQDETVTYIGRLELRKGVTDLARAIPAILKVRPQTRFRFIGKSMSYRPGADMADHLKHLLKDHLNQVDFVGSVGPDKIASLLATTDVCVFPSIWENFPNVCLEAMSAARGIVAGSAGGMAEMLDGGRVGKLVRPHSPNEITKAVLELLQDPARRKQLGIAARRRVLEEYRADRIGAMQEAVYEAAIRSHSIKPSASKTLVGSH